MNHDSSPSPDYPAAHSMDTTWFAVDRDGFVAAFDSAEGGAVPEEAANTESDDVMGALEGTVESEIIYTLECDHTPLIQGESHVQPLPARRRQPFKPLPESANVFTRWWQKVTGSEAKPSEPQPPAAPVEEVMYSAVLVTVRELAAVQEYLDRGLCQPVPTNGPLAVVFPSMPISVHKALHEQSLCRGCYWAYSLDLDDDSTQPSKLGLYYYECCEGQSAYPYGRRSLPSAPLHIDNMPQELREGLMKVQFQNLSFADTPYLQPPELVKSYSWDGGYLATDWKTYRANPGQEDQYREIYQQMSEYDDN